MSASRICFTHCVVLALYFQVALFSKSTNALKTTSNAVVNFNVRGVAGWIRFQENADRTLTSIFVNLQGLAMNVNATWSIHRLPVDQTLSTTNGDRCNVNFLGDVYNPTGAADGMRVGDLTERIGGIPSEGAHYINDTVITLSGPDSIVGRAIMVQTGTTIICATIRYKTEVFGDVVNLQARFTFPIAGTVYFRQAAADQPTVIFGKLFWVNSQTTITMNDWKVYQITLQRSTIPGVTDYRFGNCSIIDANAAIFNPTNSTGSQCAVSMQDQCIVGDLSGKHGNIDVDINPLPYQENAFFFTDSTLKLSGADSVQGFSLVIRRTGAAGQEVVACAPILPSETIEAFQYQDFDLRITQSTPFENSSIVLSERVDPNNAYQILGSAWSTNGLCPLTDPPYNPYGATGPGNNAIRTPDLYPLGDLSGRLRSLVSPSDTLNLAEYPLYGTNSLLGRTLRVSSNNPAAANYRSCSALVPLKDEETLLAVATFITGPIRGAVYFLQRQNIDFDQNPGTTNIIVDLYYMDSSAAMTTSHGWSIHTTPPLSNTDCSNVGGVFNPFEVTVDSNECTPQSTLRCAVGDLIGKHGPLSLSPPSLDRLTYSFIDNNLPLSDIAKTPRSLTIFGSGPSSTIVACAPIMKLTPNSADRDIFVSIPEDSDFEIIKFREKLVGLGALAGTVPPFALFPLRQEVGPGENPCATFQLKLISTNVGMANDYAEIAQREVCTEFADNDCLTQLPNYSQLCGVPAGSTSNYASVIVLVFLTVLAGYFTSFSTL